MPSLSAWIHSIPQIIVNKPRLTWRFTLPKCVDSKKVVTHKKAKVDSRCRMLSIAAIWPNQYHPRPSSGFNITNALIRIQSSSHHLTVTTSQRAQSNCSNLFFSEWIFAHFVYHFLFLSSSFSIASFTLTFQPTPINNHVITSTNRHKCHNSSWIRIKEPCCKLDSKVLKLYNYV